MCLSACEAQRSEVERSLCDFPEARPSEWRFAALDRSIPQGPPPSAGLPCYSPPRPPPRVPFASTFPRLGACLAPACKRPAFGSFLSTLAFRHRVDPKQGQEDPGRPLFRRWELYVQFSREDS